jgi:hypothetical protein
MPVKSKCKIQKYLHPDNYQDQVFKQMNILLQKDASYMNSMQKDISNSNEFPLSQARSAKPNRQTT